MVLELDGKRFYIQDNREKSSALLAEGFAAGFVEGFFEGLTLLLVELGATVGKYETAMKYYLRDIRILSARSQRPIPSLIFSVK